jgi:hypothetical protein
LKQNGNQPQFDLRAQLFRMCGTDLTRIDGLDATTATTILSETGLYDAQHRARQISNLKWKARQLGLQVVEAPAA